ncbi:DUF2809 domain-containing protein [Flavobacterium sp. XGLA_31]|uniref:ribosomal maturation YjgA family protein n=1 Tax=Flavobacterium sp. XGLA_31 TaxID=3447666 RepID=UPI003F2B00CC
MFRFHPRYFLLTLCLFVTEVLIALYVHDTYIRPYMGDVLVVILIYCFVKTFTTLSSKQTALYTLLFSFSIETLQYLNGVELLGLSEYKIARIVIGSSFSWLDILTYILGIAIVLLVEQWQKSKSGVGVKP